MFDSYTLPDRFGELLGYKLSAFDREAQEARVALVTTEQHLSPSGRVHGGVLASLLDYACGLAALTTLGPKDRCSTVEIKVNYFHPVDAGQSLEAVAKVAFRGRKLCALVATLNREGSEQPVAMATATFNVVEKS